MSIISFGVWAAMALMPVTVAGAQSYTITDIGPLGRPDFSGQGALNDHGAVVSSFINGNALSQAILWTAKTGVYKITPQGKLATLHSFDGTDGSQPSGTLFYASDGNFYGTTQSGGANTDGGENTAGTVFKITPEGRLTTLYNFCSEEYCTDGESPEAGVVQDTNGNLYGTTMLGGDIGCATYNYGCGTVFMVSARLPEFIEPQPTFGKESEEIEILGTNLTEAKSVLFNGTAAAFKVISASEIAAQVPAGATTGKIAVTTATRALSSILPFKVIP